MRWGRKKLTTPSQNPDFSKGVNMSTGSTSSYSSISWGADNQRVAKRYRYNGARGKSNHIWEKRAYSISNVNYIPSDPDSSEGPGPTISDIASCSGSLSCSDLQNDGTIY